MCSNGNVCNLKYDEFDLWCLTKCSYGGWITMTAHLSNRNKAKKDIIKIAKRTEKKGRDFGYGCKYFNTKYEDAISKCAKILITCVDKKYYDVLDKLKNETITKYIVIHDPTELKPPVVDFIKHKNTKVITIRKTINKLLTHKYGVKNTLLLHPYTPYFYPNSGQDTNNRQISPIAMSRVDFDKNTHLIVKANNNDIVKFPVDIYGAPNALYVYHKLNKLGFERYYKGKYPKDIITIMDMLQDRTFMVDLSLIKGDGGGTQYTFLEAIDAGCILVLHKNWIKEDGEMNMDNCITIGDLDAHFSNLENFLFMLDTRLKKNKDKFEKIRQEARKVLKRHIDANNSWRPKYVDEWMTLS